MGARGSGHAVVSPWDRSRVVAGRRGDKDKRRDARGGMRHRRDGAQRQGTTVLRHGLTLKLFEAEAVCASMDVNIWVMLWHHIKNVLRVLMIHYIFSCVRRAHIVRMPNQGVDFDYYNLGNTTLHV